MEEKKCVILLSGGIDSLTLALRKKNEGYTVYGIFFDYGQKNAAITYDKASIFASKQNISLKGTFISMDWVKSSILRGCTGSESLTKKDVYKQDNSFNILYWIPGRHALFLTLAGSYASSLGIEEVYAAFQMDTGDWEAYDKLEDKATFKSGDITPKFVELMNELSKCNYKTMVKFYTPYLDERAHANDVLSEGIKLGLDLNDTYSCRYYPACGKCAQCIIRNERIKYVKEHDKN